MILAPAIMTAEPDPKKAGAKCLEAVALDPESYRIGHTRVNANTIFFTRVPEPQSKIPKSFSSTTYTSSRPYNYFEWSMNTIPWLCPRSHLRTFEWATNTLWWSLSHHLPPPQPPFRYKILNPKAIVGVEDEKKVAEIILDASALEADLFRLGKTKAWSSINYYFCFLNQLLPKALYISGILNSVFNVLYINHLWIPSGMYTDWTWPTFPIPLLQLNVSQPVNTYMPDSPFCE